MGDTRTSDVKAGLRDFASRRASILLKRSDHFRGRIHGLKGLKSQI